MRTFGEQDGFALFLSLKNLGISKSEITVGFFKSANKGYLSLSTFFIGLRSLRIFTTC